MANGLFDNVYNPDVLSCLANLSNDEVFTPPEVVNGMLDMLPQELFSNPDTTFLDPACKTGVFLREIAKRLIVGLEPQFPDLQERLDHIFHKQLYGIAITELTSLLSRRGVYCSKYPNSEFSVSYFDDEHAQGNIRFKKIKHTWVDGKCIFCGTSESSDVGGEERGETLEAHAYELIHTKKPEDIFNMKFDVIIGNPPYQLNTAGDKNAAQAKPIYHFFIEQAKKLSPRYLTMIIPSRWFAGGWGLEDFREDMMTDRHLKELHDFPDASDCFPGVDIKGGVCYFVLDSLYDGETKFVTHSAGDIISTATRPLKEENCDIVIRYNEAIPMLRKVRAKNEATFDSIVSTKMPFGLTSTYKGKTDGPINVYAFRRMEKASKYEITRNADCVDKYKLIVPKAVGTGDSETDLIKPILAVPGTAATETYLMVGPFTDKIECENVMSYINTRFFHFMVTLQKNTHNCMKTMYSFVPMQDFTKPWTDDELFEKYGFTEEEIAFVKKMVWPNMEE